MRTIAEHRGRNGLHRSVAVSAALLGALFTVASAAQESPHRGSVELRPCPIPNDDGEMLCGTFAVYENRGAHRGRTIALNLAVLPALAPPVLIWSGAYDPSLPPKWGAYVARTLPASVHLVVPDAHGVSGPCFDAVNQRFLNQVSLAGLNTACTEAIRPPPFELPD